MIKYCVYIICLSVISVSLQAQSKSELEKRKQRTLQEITEAKRILEQTQRQKSANINQLSVLNRGIQSRESLVNNLESEILLIDRDISEKNKRIQNLDSIIEVGKKEYANIVRTVYINQTEEDKIMYLLASESFNQFYQRIKYLKYLNQYREKKVKELETLQETLRSEQDSLLSMKKQKDNILLEKKNESRKLVDEKIQKNSLLNRLVRNERKIRRQIAEKDRIRRSLEDKIRKIIEEEARKNASTSLYNSLTPEQRMVGNSFMQNKGRLPWPVDRGIITSKYGLVNHPVLPGVKISNNGVDISSAKGTEARAVFDGEVSSVFAILGANYAVIIMHGEYMSVYQNLVDLKVKIGDKVLAKQELGRIDDDEDISVLHFQIWKSKEILDPEKWLSR